MSGCDFSNLTQCDRCVLNFLHPSLMQEVSNGLGCSQIQQLLTLFRDVLNQKAMIILAINGQIEFMTPQAEQLFSQYFGCQESHTLPTCIKSWFKQQIAQISFNEDVLCSGIPLHIEQSEQELLIYWIFDPKKDRYFLLLEEKEHPTFSVASLELLGLTKREAEVLFWIAKGKGNAAVAKALGCSEGTVHKHLEHIYNKLGVQSRIGALMVALEKLGILQGNGSLK